MISRHRLDQIAERTASLNVALIGDLFLDRYLEIDPALNEPSIETGLDAYQVQHIRDQPGALGTVVQNLLALGVQRVTPISAIGNDGHGFDLLKSLADPRVDLNYIVQVPDRMTPTYTKPVVRSGDDWRELNRLDVRSRQPLRSRNIEALNSALRTAWRDCDGLIVLDQINEPDLGVVHATCRAELARLSSIDDRLMLIDSRQQLREFDFGCLKGNQEEICRAADVSPGAATGCRRAAELLHQRTSRPVFCTLGKDGVQVTDRAGKTRTLPPRPAEKPIDIVGAGDSATAAIACALLSGANEIEAGWLANLTASVTIEQLGTTGTATVEQLRARHAEWPAC